MGRTLCAAFPNTPLLSAWVKLLLPEAQPARKQVGKRGAEFLYETIKKLLLALLPNFSGQMRSAWRGGARGQPIILVSLCAAVFSNQRCQSYS